MATGCAAPRASLLFDTSSDPRGQQNRLQTATNAYEMPLHTFNIVEDCERDKRLSTVRTATIARTRADVLGRLPTQKSSS